MILNLLLILSWIIVGFWFAFALIHHIKTISGNETYNYLKDLGQETLFNSKKYCMTLKDLKLSLWLSILGPFNFVLFLIKCLGDVIVLVINLLTK
jgi:hypothetical protein